MLKINRLCPFLKNYRPWIFHVTRSAVLSCPTHQQTSKSTVGVAHSPPLTITPSCRRMGGWKRTAAVNRFVCRLFVCDKWGRAMIISCARFNIVSSAVALVVVTNVARRRRCRALRIYRLCSYICSSSMPVNDCSIFAVNGLSTNVFGPVATGLGSRLLQTYTEIIRGTYFSLVSFFLLLLEAVCLHRYVFQLSFQPLKSVALAKTSSGALWRICHQQVWSSNLCGILGWTGFQ